MWGGNLPSRRRLFYSGVTGLAVTLGGNLGGVTSGLLGLNPEASRQLKLDTLFPVKGFKRCIESGQGFEFIYPAEWLGDQRLLYRAVERAEQSRSLDLPPIRRNGGRNRTEPIVAFGPAAGSGELNVSVVVAPIAPGFRLQSLGSPVEAGQKILDNVIAREGSGKTADLLKADATPEGKYYTLEYTVRTSEWYRHNVSVYATQNDQLYSINVMCPEAEWERRKEQLRTTAASFRVTKSLPVNTFAERL
ncbi:psbP family protein [Klebsormidium nitens]|uniref:PsbP family protein n=1 Tax=Klebsormidium nitens TaxID=105231 RepID=A0A1Y1I0H8_KLENI|nr:psbP family protein [Klebsormidium nitens]|eukprot:GAQ82276.1 psbP family protein [Klebsormidium nitens]